MIHPDNCKWQKTKPEECEYRETHEYCPHDEHACSCMKNKLSDENLREATIELGRSVVDYFYMVDKWGAKNETACRGIWFLIGQALQSNTDREAELRKKNYQLACQIEIVQIELIDKLEARIKELEVKSDEEMLRVKACEHIAEGEEGWEKVENLCPSTRAVASLKKQAEELAETLKQIYEAAKPYDGESLTTSFIVEKAKYTIEAYRKEQGR